MAKIIACTVLVSKGGAVCRLSMIVLDTVISPSAIGCKPQTARNTDSAIGPGKQFPRFFVPRSSLTRQVGDKGDEHPAIRSNCGAEPRFGVALRSKLELLPQVMTGIFNRSSLFRRQ